jgi:hypothetical protein
MKKPNLVNPSLWTPFRSIPIHVPEHIPISIPEPVEIFRPITRREMIQRNSFVLNFICLIIIACISYFLYSIYLERKIFGEYLEYVKNNEKEYYPGFL